MFDDSPSSLMSHLRQVVADVTHCRAVADYDDRTFCPRGPVTPEELQEIKNRINLLFLHGPTAPPRPRTREKQNAIA